MNVRGGISELLFTIARTFHEEPGLELTLAGAERRFGIDGVTCEGLLSALVDTEYLVRHRTHGEIRFRTRTPADAVHRRAAANRERPGHTSIHSAAA